MLTRTPTGATLVIDPMPAQVCWLVHIIGLARSTQLVACTNQGTLLWEQTGASTVCMLT